MVATSRGIGLGGADVLVVDDNEESVHLLKRILSRASASPRTASSARDGLALAKERAPSVVLTDLNMRGEGGYWLLHALRRELPRRVPVIAVTREPDDGTLLRHGFDFYIRKPAVSEEVVCIVAWLVSRPTVGEEPAFPGGVGWHAPASVIASTRLAASTAALIEGSWRLIDASLQALDLAVSAVAGYQIRWLERAASLSEQSLNRLDQ